MTDDLLLKQIQKDLNGQEIVRINVYHNPTKLISQLKNLGYCVVIESDDRNPRSQVLVVSKT